MRRHPHWRYAIPLGLLLAVLGTATAQFGRPVVRPVEPVMPRSPVIGRPEPIFRPSLPTEPMFRPNIPTEPMFRPGLPREPFLSPSRGGLRPEYITPPPGLREPANVFGRSPAHVEAYHIASLDPVRAL